MHWLTLFKMYCKLSLSLHRAFRRVTWLVHQPMHTHKIVYIKTFKIAPTCSDRHQGAALFLTKITLLKTFNDWFPYNNLVLWQHDMLCIWNYSLLGIFCLGMFKIKIKHHILRMGKMNRRWQFLSPAVHLLGFKLYFVNVDFFFGTVQSILKLLFIISSVPCCAATAPNYYREINQWMFLVT